MDRRRRQLGAVLVEEPARDLSESVLGDEWRRGPADRLADEGIPFSCAADAVVEQPVGVGLLPLRFCEGMAVRRSHMSGSSIHSSITGQATSGSVRTVCPTRWLAISSTKSHHAPSTPSRR